MIQLLKIFTFFLLLTPNTYCVDFHTLPIHSKIRKNQNILLEKGKFNETIVYNVDLIKKELSNIKLEIKTKEQELEALSNRDNINIKEAINTKKEIIVLNNTHKEKKALYLDNNYFLITESDKKYLAFILKNKTPQKKYKSNSIEFIEYGTYFKNKLLLLDDTLYYDNQERTILNSL